MYSQQQGIGIDVNRPGAGAPNVDKSGNLKIRKGQTLTKSSNGRKYSAAHAFPSLCHVYSFDYRPRLLSLFRLVCRTGRKNGRVKHWARAIHSLLD